MQYPVELNVQYPEKLSRLTTFFRIFMIIPHAIVLYFIAIAFGVVQFISWWAILFTGRFPRSLFDFSLWCTRWMNRVNIYTYLMTDKYPPFSGEPSTFGQAGNASNTINAGNAAPPKP
jgi:hypothetical protein